jgi:Ferritin-like
MPVNAVSPPPTLRQAPRELIVHALYEAAEIEHNLMCTYLYAAFSLKTGTEEGLSEAEAAATARWRREIISVAIDEMSHLAAVWNITSALGAVPRFGRTNFPLDPGFLPARIVVKLAPFSQAVLQHFIFLERPAHSEEPEGEGFAPERLFARGSTGQRLTPLGIDYATVGEFYASLGEGLRGLVERLGESAAFCGDPALQLTPAEVDLPGARRVICLKSALAAFDAIVLQGEGSKVESTSSHFARFLSLREEYRALLALNPAFEPAHPAATNPVLRRPPRPEGRVWIEAEPAIATVDLANAGYGLMLRLLAHAYAVPAPHPDKALVVDLAIGLMRAVTPLGERAARLPAGPSNPHCHAGMSFTTLRDSAPLAPGAGARRFFVERLAELATAAAAMEPKDDPRLAASTRLLAALAARARQRLDPDAPVPEIPKPPTTAPVPSIAPDHGAGPVDSPRHERRGLDVGRERSNHGSGWHRIGRGTGADAALRGPPLHPRPLLRHRRPGRVPRQRPGPVDPPGRDGHRAPHRNRPRLPVGRDPLPAQGRPARRGGSAREPGLRARERPVCGARCDPPRRRRDRLSRDAV